LGSEDAYGQSPQTGGVPFRFTGRQPDDPMPPLNQCAKLSGHDPCLYVRQRQAHDRYAYDGFDRLITTTFPDATYEAQTYDAQSNPLTKRNRAGVTLTFAYDALNRMATKAMPLAGGGTLTTSWTYDLAGRTTDLADTNGHDLAYTFDTAKRLTAVARQVPGLTGAQTVAYQYDAASNRTRVTWPDGYYVQYQFDGLNRMSTASENGTYLRSGPRK